MRQNMFTAIIRVFLVRCEQKVQAGRLEAHDCNHAWWRHQMKTFSVLLALCAGNSQDTGEFPSQRPVTRSFDVFFYLSLNKPLSKQLWGRLFETPWRSLWRYCNGEAGNWDRVTHICVSNYASTGLDNGLSPDRRQVIIRTNAGILSIGPVGINFSEIIIKIHAFSLR